MDFNLQKIHSTYLLVGYLSIFTYFWIYLSDFFLKYLNFMHFTPVFGPRVGLFSLNIPNMDLNQKTIHSKYLLVGYFSMFTNFWIYLGDFFLKYLKFMHFTPGFGPKTGVNLPKHARYGPQSRDCTVHIFISPLSIDIYLFCDLFRGYLLKIP